jgi:hypothetical protein
MNKKNCYSGEFRSVLLLILLITLSCDRDNIMTDQEKPNLDINEVLKDGGVLVLNEGNFMYGNASLSYYNGETGTVINDVFYRQNDKVPLGDVAQSAVIYNGELYVVMNNSGKIMVMNFGKYPALKAFEFTHKITGLQSPRYISFIDSSKAYISDLYSKSISILDPAGYSVTGKINLANQNPDFYQHPTEQLIVFGNEVFTNCYSFDDKILVIDRITDRLADSISVLQQPNSIVLDRNGKIWALCDGGYEGSEYGKDQPGLVRIDAHTHTVEKIFILNDESWPSKLCINGSADTLYFINRDVWRMPVDAVQLPDKAFIEAVSSSGTKLFYGLGIDPKSSEIFVSDAIDHVQSGMVYRFRADGMAVDTFLAGIIPGSFVFF